MKNPTLSLFQIITLLISVVLSLFAFYTFIPYKFVDHENSRIICLNNHQSYTIGPNLFYLFSTEFDSNIDKNVRKLCEFGIINDFQDTYKTPNRQNYQLQIVQKYSNGWGDALLIGVSVFLFIYFALIKVYPSVQKYHHIHTPGLNFYFLNSITIILGFAVFYLFLSKPAKFIHCEKNQASKLSDFKKSAYGFGLIRILQAEQEMSSTLKKQFRKCIR